MCCTMLFPLPSTLCYMHSRIRCSDRVYTRYLGWTPKEANMKNTLMWMPSTTYLHITFSIDCKWCNINYGDTVPGFLSISNQYQCLNFWKKWGAVEATGCQNKVFITKNKIIKILYHRAIVTKITWYWHKTRQRDRWDRIEDPEISLHCYSLLNF
jgi:hypothetical protein